MNGTPRLRSAYPSTPTPAQKSAALNGSAWSPQGGASPRSPRTSPPAGLTRLVDNHNDNGPLIPFDIVDAPSQRRCVCAFYVLLSAWRFYDYFRLVYSETDSLWFFMKWVVFDGVFLYGLPGLKVPWLELSSSTTTVVFLLHAFLNAMLMFRIQVCVFVSQTKNSH